MKTEQSSLKRKTIVLDSYHAAEGIPDINKMTREQFDMELSKGYKDVLEGRTVPMKQAFAEIRKEFAGMRCAQPIIE